MKMMRYGCTHCGRKFEAEEKDVLECPGCFWSTSVKREEDFREEPLKGSVRPSAAKLPFSLKLPALPWKPVAAGALLIIGVLIFVKAGLPLLSKFKQQAKSPSEKPAAGLPAETPRPELAGLSGEDQNILKRRVQINLDRVASEEEQKILSNRAVFKSGFSEKLPSQTWTIENFKDMIAQQEKFYQVPLPGSYKNKLYDLFKSKYAAGAEAFKTGNLIQARNLWVESLAFPIYANNPEKHRGVVLTMMRPFINDTLSKIGTINGASVEKTVREKEKAAVAEYEKLVTLLEKKAWPEALASISEFNRKLIAFSTPASLAGGPEEYSQGISLVDRDIQVTLRGLLTVTPPAMSDLEPLKMDVLRKKRVIEGFIPENVKAMQQKYDEAMDALARGDWAVSEKTLKEVALPADLYLDAQDKIQVLKKLLKESAADFSGGVPAKRNS